MNSFSPLAALTRAERGKIFIYLLAVWLAVYLLLRFLIVTSAGPVSRPLAKKGEFSRELLPQPASGESPAPETLDPLEREYKTFNCPSMTMSALGVLLREDFGLKFDYPRAAKKIRLQGGDLSGKNAASILLSLLKGEGYGFFREGDTINALPVTVLRTSRDNATSSTTMDTASYQTTLSLEPGHSADWWISGEPPVFLRIAAMPLFGEESEAREVGVELEARRGPIVLFRQALVTAAGETGYVEVRGRERVSCRVKPLLIEKSTVRLEIIFLHETRQTETRQAETRQSEADK